MQKKDLNEGRVNSIIGTALGYGFISPSQVPYAVAILFISIPFMFSNPLKGVLIFACIYGLFWILTGNDPSKFFERLKKPKRYISEEPSVNFDRAGVPKPKMLKNSTTDFKINQKRVNHSHIERKFFLRTYGQIELDSKKIGFYLLRRGSEVMVISGWRVRGYDSSMTTDEAFAILNSSTDALNQLPNDIDLKVYQDINGSCSSYRNQQQELLTKDLDPLSQKIVTSRIDKARQLETQGRIQNNDILVFAKYRVPLGQNYAVKQNWLDDFLSKTQPLVGMLRGQKFDSNEAWSKVLDSAYHYAYKKVNNLLTSNKGFGLEASSLNVFQLWARDYLELHSPPIIPLPQYIIYNHNGLQPPIINSGTHALGSLFEPAKGINVVPRFGRTHIHYPHNGKFAAFVRIGQVQKFPPYKQDTALGYMRYVWNIIAEKTTVTDCRIISEITPDRSGFEMLQLDRIISNSVKREALAAKKQTVDVVAMRRREQAVEARDLLEDNNIPFWVSIGIWLYRDSIEALEQDISNLCQDIPSAAVERVENSVEDVWFQSQTFEWSAFLTKPNHRRQKYYSFQSIPLLPLIKTKQIDRRGMMFLTRELNSPVLLDIANEKNHTGIFAKSGAGKSNIILEMLIEYVIHKQLVVLFDFPRPDGTSTYTVLIPILQRLGVKAAYHNVKKNTTNIIELPDLRSAISEENYQERLNYTLEAHVRLLCAIVMGTSKNSDREVLVNSLLSQCYSDFHNQKDIKRRYSEAIEGGYGSSAYQKMPIYEDFVVFAESWFGDYVQDLQKVNSELSKETIDLILIQLRGILKTSLGRSLNGISSFNTDVDILVIGLTDVSDNLDSLLYAMTGLNALYRGAFSSKRSLLGIDEGTILYKFHFFARETGIIPVHGRKWGCNFLVAAQEVKTIKESVVGGEIFKNLDNIFCGGIESTAIDEMVDLEFRRPILQSYTTEAFKPSRELLQSYWYLKRGDRHLEVTHTPSELILALGATDPQEEYVRKKIRSKYGHEVEDEIEAIEEFARINVAGKKRGVNLDDYYNSVC